MQSDLSKTQLFDLIREKKKYFLHIPLAVYWAILLIFTSIPSDSVPQIWGLSDKIEHFGAFMVLSFILTFSLFLREKKGLLSRYYLLFGVVFSSLYGIVDEIHQAFIPGRYCEFYDFLADFIGSVIGSLVVFGIIKVFNKNQAN